MLPVYEEEKARSRETVIVGRKPSFTFWLGRLPLKIASGPSVITESRFFSAGFRVVLDDPFQW